MLIKLHACLSESVPQMYLHTHTSCRIEIVYISNTVYTKSCVTVLGPHMWNVNAAFHTALVVGNVYSFFSASTASAATALHVLQFYFVSTVILVWVPFIPKHDRWRERGCMMSHVHADITRECSKKRQAYNDLPATRCTFNTSNPFSTKVIS